MSDDCRMSYPRSGRRGGGISCRHSAAFAAHLACLLVLCASRATGASASRFSYGDQGWQYDDGTGNNYAWFGARLQSRVSTQNVTEVELPGAPTRQSSDANINRARLKLGGHVLRPGLNFYTEYDLVGGRTLDLRGTIKFNDALSVRVGQWKSDFNRERIDSSGKQQFVERSISTPWFTIDRQQGVVASGRVGKGGSADLSYWAGWLTGAGRGGPRNRADGLWMTRVQWNVGGRLLGFSQSAVDRPERPTGSIAIAAVGGKSGFTAFSSDGGGQLPGFLDGAPDRYRLEQWLLETAYQYRGFSWQQELHWKRVEDRTSGAIRRLLGGYAQAGVFPAAWFDDAPAPLELAIRISLVDVDESASDDIEKEFTIGANWFFNGHRNKLTLDISHLQQNPAGLEEQTDRLRLQWDWSF